jgi:hypothetical protein
MNNCVLPSSRCTPPQAGGREDARAYQAAPPAQDEFSIADNPLAWEGEGWDEY